MSKHHIIAAIILVVVGYILGTQFPSFGSGLVTKAKGIV